VYRIHRLRLKVSSPKDVHNSDASVISLSLEYLTLNLLATASIVCPCLIPLTIPHHLLNCTFRCFRYRLASLACQCWSYQQKLCIAACRIFSQIPDGSTAAFRRQHFFRWRQKGRTSLICCKKHLTTDRCLLCHQVQMAVPRKSPGMALITKPIYMVDQRSKEYSVLYAL